MYICPQQKRMSAGKTRRRKDPSPFSSSIVAIGSVGRLFRLRPIAIHHNTTQSQSNNTTQHNTTKHKTTTQHTTHRLCVVCVVLFCVVLWGLFFGSSTQLPETCFCGIQHFLIFESLPPFYPPACTALIHTGTIAPAF
jgi:hypothetical protein